MARFPGNQAKFAALRSLNLPFGHYAVTSSGPLGIRDIRAISDIDIIVDDSLWAELSIRYAATHDRGFDRIAIDPWIEIFGPDSYLASRTISPTVAEQIHSADLIDGLPFVRLDFILYFKRHVLLRDPHRTKHANDLFDIQAITSLLVAA